MSGTEITGFRRKPYKNLQAIARKTATFQFNINSMEVVQGELVNYVMSYLLLSHDVRTNINGYVGGGKMLAFLGLAAVAIGMLSFDFSSASDGESGLDDASDEDDIERPEENGYISMEPHTDDVTSDSDAKQVAEDARGAQSEHEVGTGVVTDPQAQPEENSGNDASNMPNGGELGQAPSVVISGTDSSDVLSGVNVHIDIATKIVTLFGNTVESLVGGEGDDTLAIGAGDFAEGGAGSDEFIVDGDQAEASSMSADVPTISDFVVGEDKLVISLPTSEEQLAQTYPDRPELPLDVSVDYAAESTLVSVAGAIVCKLAGVLELSADDIEIEYDYHSSIKSDFDELYGYD